MSDISLHDYLEQIERLLENERLTEADAHCRHILEQHPRHIDSYRILGKALLEQREYSGAADVFQRVLSAVPEDFISHVGLSITYKEDELLPQAVWHMERAYEMDPYNAAIQQELRELYGRRDGRMPERVSLTRGALARLYARGDLYQQAAAELRQALTEDDSRVDLQTLLAEVLWRDDQRVEAVDICLAVLDRLPNCIAANAILAEVWLLSGRIDEAQEYLQRLQALTLPDASSLAADTPLGRAFQAEGALSLPDQVMVEQLEYEALEEAAEPFSLDEAPDWVYELGKVDDDWAPETADRQDEDEVLDWLREAAVADEMDEEDAEPEMFDVASPDAADTPDWLSDLTFDEAAPETTAVPDETTPDAESDLPDWLADIEETAAGDGDRTPDWLDDLTAVDEEGETAPSTSSGQAVGEEQLGWTEEDEFAAVDSSESMPDWLEDLAQEQGDEAASIDEAESELEAAELPGWLTGALELPQETEDEPLPDWLTDVEIPNGVTEFTEWDEADEQPDSMTAESTEEMVELSAEETTDMELTMAEHEPEMEQPDFLEDDNLDDAMAWLEQLAAQQGAPLEELPTLQQAAAEEADEEPEAIEEDAAIEMEEIPNWLQAEEMDEPETTGLTAWLKEIEEESADELSAEAEAEALPADEIPDWLQAPDDPDQPETAAEADDLSWLDQLAAGQGEVFEEPPTLTWGDEVEPVEEEAAAEPVAEMDAVDESEAAVAGEALDEADFDVPEDLDDAMAWLEQLAARQGASLDELPTVDALSDEAAPEPAAKTPDDMPEIIAEPEAPVAEVEADEAGAEFDAPEDLDDAMAWLEQLAAQQGAPLEELPTMEQRPLDESEGVEMVAPVEAEEPADASAFDEAEAVVEDDAMAWLDQLEAEEPDAEEAEPAMEAAEPETAAQPEEPESVDDAIAEKLAEYVPYLSGDELDEMPDDPDEAIAWLEQLAAQEEAPADHVEMEREEIGEETELAAEPEPEAPADDYEEMSELAPELTGQDVSESLPDWLQLGADDDGWVEEAGEAAVADWLSAEEEATVAPYEEPPLVTAPLEREPVPVAEQPAAEPEPAPEPDMEPAVEPVAVAGAIDLDDERLNEAQRALTAGEFEQARAIYESLIETGDGMHMLIAALETAVAQHSRRPLLRRLLGDAYMRNGQLQKALDTYRQALDQL